MDFFINWFWFAKLETKDGKKYNSHGPLITTAVSFFVAELGDKSQLATLALASYYQNISWVLLGTITAMLLVNVPIVYLGTRLSDPIPNPIIQRGAAVLMLILGLAILVNLIL